MDYRFRRYEFDDTPDTSGEAFGSTLRLAMIFGAVGLGAAVLAAPLMQGAVDYYAQYRGPGIDGVLTGSVQKNERYTVRKSVLAPGAERICDKGSAFACRFN